jgi:A/G-specific adenine glycosylase
MMKHSQASHPPITTDPSSSLSDWLTAEGRVFTDLLLSWFDQSARMLPWRQIRDPYRVLLSELMLQQTQVATVIPYYERFLRLWPTIEALANADESAVLKAWEGLGYYSRARNLLAAARQVRAEHGGCIPADLAALGQLKGVGDYTAGAIRSIAYNLPAAAVDGNVVRVMSRQVCVSWEPGNPKQRREVAELIEHVQPPGRPGDFNEALMDLGATICLPKGPLCDSCPVRSSCQAAAFGVTAHFPARKVRRSKAEEALDCLVVEKEGLFHVRQRPTRGLLAGLYEFDWGLPETVVSEAALAEARVMDLGSRRHVFTHRVWRMHGHWLQLEAKTATPLLDHHGQWVDREALLALPFPTALSAWRELVALTTEPKLPAAAD